MARRCQFRSLVTFVLRIAGSLVRASSCPRVCNRSCNCELLCNDVLSRNIHRNDISWSWWCQASYCSGNNEASPTSPSVADSPPLLLSPLATIYLLQAFPVHSPHYPTWSLATLHTFYRTCSKHYSIQTTLSLLMMLNSMKALHCQRSLHRTSQSSCWTNSLLTESQSCYSRPPAQMMAAQQRLRLPSMHFLVHIDSSSSSNCCNIQTYFDDHSIHSQRYHFYCRRLEAADRLSQECQSLCADANDSETRYCRDENCSVLWGSVCVLMMALES